MTETLSVEHLHVTLQLETRAHRVVRDVSFEVKLGQTTAIVGESGSGKTLTALSLVGLLPEGAHVSGTITIDGQPLLSLDEAGRRALRGRHVGFVFEDARSALNPFARVGQLLRAPLTAHLHLSRRKARARALQALTQVGLPHGGLLWDEYPHELSEGDCQRVHLAMALACNPRWLVLDEPTKALDSYARAHVVRLLRNLQAEGDLGILLIAHDLALVAEIASTVIIMYAGQVVEMGPAALLLRAPVHPYTRGLLGSRIPAEFDGPPEVRRLPTIPGSLERDRVDSGCRFRARCAYRQTHPPGFERCDTTEPALTAITPGHAARCHFTQELS